jgi:hypothetical protein
MKTTDDGTTTAGGRIAAASLSQRKKQNSPIVSRVSRDERIETEVNNEQKLNQYSTCRFGPISNPKETVPSEESGGKKRIGSVPLVDGPS